MERLEPQAHGGALKRTEAPPDVDTGIPTPDPKKQWWWRPADSKARKQCEQIAVMDAGGMKDADIAARFNKAGHTYTDSYIRNLRYIARKNGWWDDDDQPVDIEADLALDIDRKIVRNLSASLDGKMTNWQTHETTLKAAAGRGHFKTHSVDKHEGTQTLGIIGVQIIMPTGDAQPMLSPEECGGVPSFIDGELEPAMSGLLSGSSAN